MIVFLFILMRFCSCGILNPEGYFIGWLTIGPFEGIKKESIEEEMKFNIEREFVKNESALEPIAGKKYGGKECKAFVYTRDWHIMQGYICIYDPYGLWEKKSSIGTYACVYIGSPVDRDANIFFSCSGPTIIYLNGKQIFKTYKGIPFVRDYKKLKIKLKKGWNTLLMKFYAVHFIAQMYIRILDDSYSPIEDLVFSLTKKEKIKRKIYKKRVIKPFVEKEKIIKW